MSAYEDLQWEVAEDLPFPDPLVDPDTVARTLLDLLSDEHDSSQRPKWVRLDNLLVFAFREKGMPVIYIAEIKRVGFPA